MKSIVKTIGKALGQRISGSGPGALRALLVAFIVGIGAAILTYRLLRSGD